MDYVQLVMNALMLILIVFICFILIFRMRGVSIRSVLRRKYWQRSHNKNKRQAATIEQCVINALGELHCDVEWSGEGDDRIAVYDYQNGHFRLRILKNSFFVRLSYLFCYSTTTEDVNLVRTVCNQCNINSEVHRVIYSIDEAKNRLDLHIVAGLPMHPDIAAETLVAAMNGMFGWQNALVQKINEMKGEGASAGADKEMVDAATAREMFLMRQQEIRLQGAEQLRANDTRALTLGDFLDKVMGLQGLRPKRLAMVHPQGIEITAEEEILGFDLTRALFADGKCVAKEAVALLWTELKGSPGEVRLVTLTFDSEGSDGKTDYFRLTACLSVMPASPKHPFREPTRELMCNSALLAYDHVSREQQFHESNYMWKEAVRRMKDKEQEPLTDEMQLLVDCTSPELANCLYQGQKLFMADRFYEALLYFENAFLLMRGDFDKMKTSMRETFYNTIYYIGFCYCELRQYLRAEAYLGMLVAQHRVLYTKEYVNALVNGGDHRALEFIDQLIHQLNATLEMDEEDKPQHIFQFLAFLKRRKVYVLVEKKRYEEARKNLMEMLDDPECADFAINELAYIQKLLDNNEQL